jgi:hypothetical protein
MNVHGETLAIDEKGSRPTTACASRSTARSTARENRSRSGRQLSRLASRLLIGLSDHVGRALQSLLLVGIHFRLDDFNGPVSADARWA